MINRVKIKKGARVLVKMKSDRGVRVREGIVVDAQGNCLLVEFKWLCFRWRRWLPIRDDRVELSFPTIDQ